MADNNSDEMAVDKYLELIANSDLAEPENLNLVADYLAACISACEATSMELYEHYRKPVDLLRKGVRVLARQSWWISQQYDHLAPDVRSSLAATILKACELKVILAEKYQSVGKQMQTESGVREKEEQVWERRKE